MKESPTDVPKILGFVNTLFLFWKIKVCLWDHPAVCLCIFSLNYWMPEPVFMKLGVYIMAPSPISAESLCVFVYPLYSC
jgi:hypothetical protein